MIDFSHHLRTDGGFFVQALVDERGGGSLI
jgi:hypothetical protein